MLFSEVALQPSEGNELGSLTYHVLGGILDFYVFTGPTALNVVEQYVSLIGRPTMPPFWALGFHLCRWGYMNSTVLRQVIQRNRAADIPYVSRLIFSCSCQYIESGRHCSVH